MKEVVSSMRKMRNLSGLLILAVALAMVGCQPKEKVELASGGGSGSAAPESIDGDAQKAEAVKNQIEELSKPSDDLNIPDVPVGWEDAKPSAAPIKKSLGERIDDAFKNIPPTKVTIQTEFTDRGSVLKTTPTMRIQDENRFSIEYALPETKAAVNSITADGNSRAIFEDGKRTDLPALGKTRSRSKMTRKEIEEFAMRMPVEGFSYYAYGDRPWSALVSGLQDPKNGFDVKVEEMDANPIGEVRPFYRLVAESKKGNKLKIEFVVDSKRDVPVIFRTNLEYPDGKERLMVWRAQWQFGGNFEKNEFKIPMESKKST